MVKFLESGQPLVVGLATVPGERGKLNSNLSFPNSCFIYQLSLLLVVVVVVIMVARRAVAVPVPVPVAVAVTVIVAVAVSNLKTDFRTDF